MLRKWHTPTAVSLFADEAESQASEDDNDDLVTWKDEDGYGIPQLGEHLHPKQKQEIQDVLAGFSDVLFPRTTVVQHHIDTGRAKPVDYHRIAYHMLTVTQFERNISRWRRVGLSNIHLVIGLPLLY